MKDLLVLFARYGRGDLLAETSLDEELLREEMPGRRERGKPEKLADDLERLGPLFVKLGQVLSSRPDLMPKPYTEALARLYDRVTPFASDQARAIVEKELGVRLSHAFSSFDEKPLAAASLGQVHRATLNDGRPVVVKVQRPGVRAEVLDDLDLLDDLAAKIERHTRMGRAYALGDLVREFRKTVLRELDYRNEARNLEVVGANVARHDRLLVPSPIRDYTTSRVLTMEYVEGEKVTELSPLRRIEIDGAALAEELTKTYLDMVLVDGFFHSDPHPGNVFLTTDGRLALLDLGQASIVDPGVQEDLLRLLLAVHDGHGREAARISVRMGRRMDGFDEDTYAREVSDIVGRYRRADPGRIRLGRLVLEMARIAAVNGVRPVPELALLGKTMLHLDTIGRTLDPDFDPAHVIEHHVESVLRRHVLHGFTPKRAFSTAVETAQFLRRLPSRLSLLLDQITGRELEFRVDAIDERRLIQGFQRIANRVALGVVLAALIVGAALMMRVETEFRIFGYPGFAMILFLLAAAGGALLALSVLFLDEPRPRD